MTDKSVDRVSVVIILPAQLQNNQAPASRAWHIFRELNASRIKVVLIGRQSTSDSITESNVIAIRPVFGRGFIGNFLFLFQLLIVVMRVLFHTRAEQVLVRGEPLSVLFPILKLWRKIIIYDCHSMRHREQRVEGRIIRARITQLFVWLALKLADHIIVIREELRQDMPPEFQKKSFLMPNGVDLEEFAAPEDEGILARYSIPQNKKLVGFIGNWEHWIAIEDMLESVQYFDYDIKIVIIGEGRKLEKYEAIYPSIMFTGMLPHKDAIGILKKMAICVCPYSIEPIAKNKSYRKIYEYLAAGKPIVISDADSREKFLKDGENVLMYRAGDAGNLAAKVKTILNNDELYTKMSRNNLELAKQFTWKEVIARSGLIELLLGS